MTTLRPDVVARHARRNLPRYTSYPTAPHFRPAGGEVDARAWLARVPAEQPVSLYVHVPFCRSMCWYCGCHTTITRRDAPIVRYLDSLRQEIGLVAKTVPHRLQVRHLHFGGGTPTVMEPEQFLELNHRLRSAFDFTPDAELAIEIDPRTLAPAMVEALAACGINRASLGVQSFDPKVQAAINRIQPFEQTRDAVDRLRAAGIKAVNLDLIYGLPSQTVASCLDTVRQAVLLKPDRLAVFGYAHVPGFKQHQRKIDTATLPDGQERMAQAEAIAGALIAAGYEQIGLDHFALREDTLAVAARTGGLHRNFQGYTTDPCPTLIGLGASSIGRLPGGFVQNSVLIGDYQQRVAEGRLAVTRQCATSEEDDRRSAIIMRLMCDYRIDLSADLDLVDEGALALLEADGLITRDGTTVLVNDEARPLVRAVAAAFDAYLDEDSGRHSRAA